MKKLLLILLFFITALNSNDLSLNENLPIYKSIEISTNINNINEAINHPEKFAKHKYFRRYLIKKKVDENSWYKIDLHNNSQKTLERRILTKWDHTIIDIYIVENNKVIFKNTLKRYKNFQLSNIFKIEANQDLQLFMNVKIEKGIDSFFYFYIIPVNNEFDLIRVKDIFHNGIFLGLLIAMMMYNFFMYLSMKIKSYLYLALYQMVIVIYISDISYYSIIFFENYSEISYLLFKILITIFMTIFSFLFTKEFLNIKKTMPFLNILLNVFLVLHIIFQTIVVSHVNYVAFLYILFISAGFISLKQGNKFALYYIIGFTPTVLFYISTNIIRALEIDIYIEYQSIIQILAVIEAFALSMALYLKLKQTVDEKEKAQKEVHEKEKQILEQSRFATMGEMLGSISHQWKQPLNHLTMIFASLQLADETKKLDSAYLNKKVDEANNQVKYMATTINDFNNFLSSKKELESFTLEEICKEALALSDSRVKKLNVKIDIIIEQDKTHYNYKNGLIQILIIVLNNALDALVLNNIKNRAITMTIKGNSICIDDNAGGIPNEVISKIFDPYFSTKDKKFGTGMGLYTAKIVIERILEGKIVATNHKNGASFLITIP